MIRTAVATFPATSSENYSPCTHANGGCNLESRYPAPKCTSPAWTPMGPISLSGAARTPARNGDDDRAGAGLLRLPEGVLGASERRRPASSSSASSVIPALRTSPVSSCGGSSDVCSASTSASASSIPDPGRTSANVVGPRRCTDPVLEASVEPARDVGSERRPPPRARVARTRRRVLPARARRPRASARSPVRPRARVRRPRARRARRTSVACGRTTSDPLASVLWTVDAAAVDAFRASSSVETVASPADRTSSRSAASSSSDVSAGRRSTRPTAIVETPDRIDCFAASPEPSRQDRRTRLLRARKEDRELALAAPARDVARVSSRA